MSLRDEILGNRDFPVSPPIEVPGWKVDTPLHFRTLTAGETDRAELNQMQADPLSWILEHGKSWNKISDSDLAEISGN
jgi:hypothetical protein